MHPNSLQLDADGVYRVPAFRNFTWLEHGFGTRLSTTWPDSSRLRTLHQVHSACSIVVDSPTPGRHGEGDALLTDRPGLLVGVRTADCVPLLLVDPSHRAVAAVHAGWRGTAQSIAMNTVSDLVRQFGTDPRDVYAAIGPAIGSCCYEVGPEVAREFTRWWPELERVVEPAHLDLVQTNQLQLQEAGIPAERIFTGGPCTYCTADTLESYRRDGAKSGRMVAAIGIR